MSSGVIDRDALGDFEEDSSIKRAREQCRSLTGMLFLVIDPGVMGNE
jgi:hypothetical protein